MAEAHEEELQLRPNTGALVALTIALGAVAPTAAQAKPSTDGVERSVVSQLNGIRAQSGLPKLRLDGRLNRAADAHSADMARVGFFSHDSSDGTSMADRVARYTPARSTGETLAYVGARQRRKAAAVVRLWMGSPSHRAALMTRSFRRIGIAKRKGDVDGQRSALFTADLSTAR